MRTLEPLREVGYTGVGIPLITRGSDRVTENGKAAILLPVFTKRPRIQKPVSAKQRSSAALAVGRAIEPSRKTNARVSSPRRRYRATTLAPAMQDFDITHRTSFTNDNL